MQKNNTEVTLDDLQNGYYIYQQKNGFRFGVDAVLLSRFAAIRKNDTVLDMGTGTGILPILLAARTACRRFIGLEIQASCVRLAEESIRYNGLQDKITVVEGDIRQASSIFGQGTIDVVVSNPPYMPTGCGLKNEDAPRYIARSETLCGFEDLASETSKVLKNRGRFFFIHRPFRLAEIIVKLNGHLLEPKRIRFVHSYAGREPVMVLIEALKGGSPGVRVERPLVIYEKNGDYTDEIRAIYG